MVMLFRLKAHLRHAKCAKTQRQSLPPEPLNHIRGPNTISATFLNWGVLGSLGIFFYCNRNGKVVLLYIGNYCIPRSPGTHVLGSWVTDSIKLCRVLRTGTQYIGNWASRVSHV